MDEAVDMNVLVLVLALLGGDPASENADVEAPAHSRVSVDAGRKALQPWFGYPWYDAPTDGLRRVEVSARRSPAKPLVSAVGSLLQIMVWTILALILAAIVYLLLRAYLLQPRQARSPLARAAPGDADRIESLPFPVHPGRTDLLAEARRCYQDGQYGQAIVYLFSFQLVQLDKRQIIRLARGKTDRQYLREVGPRNALRQIVEQTMATFEDAFFGGRTIDRASFEACWSRVEEFEALIGT